MENNFSKRLTQACDDNPLIPDYGHGRQVTIANKLGVSQEAVRKWFNNESVPRAKKMKALAEFLGVSQQWLQLGIKPTMDRTAQREMVRVAKGAIYMLAGMISLEGGNFAFPSPDDSRTSFVDLYAIKDGYKIDFHVSVGRKIEDIDKTSTYEFVIPREFTDVHVLGLVYLQGGEVEWVNLKKGILDEHKKAADGLFNLEVTRDNGKYFTGKDKIDRFKTVGEIIK